MKRSKEVITKNCNQEEIHILQCWKCRKCIATSGCFMKYLENQVIKGFVLVNADEVAGSPIYHILEASVFTLVSLFANYDSNVYFRCNVHKAPLEFLVDRGCLVLWNSGDPGSKSQSEGGYSVKVLKEIQSSFTHVTDGHGSAYDQNTCHVWHMNIESLPEWISRLIQKAQWTVGKLNCPFCGARLGGFNFVSTPKCSCGLRTAVHLSKSRTDCQPAQAGRLMRPSLKYLSHPGLQSGCDTETQLTGGAFKNRNHRLLNMAQNNNGSGRLTEALCLEVRSTYFQMKKEKLLFKASNPKYQLFVPQLVPGRCTRRASHRKSHSLDLNISEKLTLLPALYEIHSKTTAHSRRNETQPVDLSDSPLESTKNSCSFQISSSFDPNRLLQRISVVPHETQTQRGEFQCGLEASAVYSDHAGSDSLTFLMDLPSAGRSTLEASDHEEHRSPLDFLRSGSFSLGAINQRLSKRERSKLKNLRRKQRRHERWLQKQTLTNDMSTDDENEYVEEKESYICAVCLDVYFNPYMCYPCHHIFCEPCLRTLAKDNPASTPCPLCRTIISRVFFQTELNNATKTFFTKEYLKIKQSFQKSSSAKWPLPSCRKKAFRLFGGFHRHAAPVTRRQFPHGAHRMDYLHFEDDSRGWWFDMDMVIIYIYSVNWVIGFIVFCFLCYFFFPF